MVIQKRKTSVIAGKKPASIIAQEKLLELFQNGAFTSKQTLKESVLATQLGVSRPAMREALNQAIGWGIVEYKPYCGYSVREITIYDLLESFEVREAIEPIAARRIAQVRPVEVLKKLACYVAKMKESMAAGDGTMAGRYDSKFHLTVINNCGNRNFSRMQNISSMITTFYFNSFGKDEFYRHNVPSNTSKFLDEDFTDEEFDYLNKKLTLEMHCKMLHKLQTGDADGAEQDFRKHAKIQVDNIRNIIAFQQGLLTPGQAEVVFT
jgi:DNA-binding GntR family transcriptional regulator